MLESKMDDLQTPTPRLIVKPSAGYQRMVVVLLSLNIGIVFFDRFALNFLMPFVQPDLHLTNTQVGAFTSALSLSWALSCLLIGRVSDAWGRRKPILVMCTVVFACMSFLSGVANGFVALLLARLLMGIAEGGVTPLSHAVIVSTVDPSRRGVAMGVIQNFGSNLLGSFLSPLVLVALATHYGWRSAFYVAGVPGLLSAAALMFCIKETPLARTTTTRPLLRDLFASRNVWLCATMSALLVAFVMIFVTFTPILLTQGGIDRTTMSWLMATFGIASVVYSVIVPGSSDLWGRRPVVIMGALLGVLLPVAAGHLSGPLWYLLAVFALGSAITGIFPIVMGTIPSESVRPEMVGTVLGIGMGVGEAIGGTLGPICAGAVADAFGIHSTLWILSGLAVLTAALGLRLRETAPVRLRRSAIAQADVSI